MEDWDHDIGTSWTNLPPEYHLSVNNFVATISKSKRWEDDQGPPPDYGIQLSEHRSEISMLALQWRNQKFVAPRGALAVSSNSRHQSSTASARPPSTYAATRSSYCRDEESEADAGYSGLLTLGALG